MMFLLYFITIVAILTVIVFAAYILIFVRPSTRRQMPDSLLTSYAHRGLFSGEIPENSLSAFSAAVDAGYGIELDLQLSRDGEVMVFHDYTLIRMTGKEGKLCDLSLNLLKELYLKNTMEKIPTFREVLELVSGRVPILIELKGESLNSKLCKKTAEALCGYRGDYCVESFNPLLIKNIKKYLPDVFTGQLYTNVCRDKKKISPLNILLTTMSFNFLSHPDFIAYNKEYRTSLPVRLATDLYQAPRFVWTIKTEDEMRKALSEGEFAIFEKGASGNTGDKTANK